ncbi:unnamed protein product [Protopolystoma xenopodis]|uniref:Uncharacterized protein n=1 Tax=Protopolystoma xenopodis TaxID=117903 RepID=A0A448WBS5_9PLAT|nr:unnamed protein product [Protopolystoma xenopodis]
MLCLLGHAAGTDLRTYELKISEEEASLSRHSRLFDYTSIPAPWRRKAEETANLPDWCLADVFIRIRQIIGRPHDAGLPVTSIEPPGTRIHSIKQRQNDRLRSHLVAGQRASMQLWHVARTHYSELNELLPSLLCSKERVIASTPRILVPSTRLFSSPRAEYPTLSIWPMPSLMSLSFSSALLPVSSNGSYLEASLTRANFILYRHSPSARWLCRLPHIHLNLVYQANVDHYRAPLTRLIQGSGKFAGLDNLLRQLIGCNDPLDSCSITSLSSSTITGISTIDNHAIDSTSRPFHHLNVPETQSQCLIEPSDSVQLGLTHAPSLSPHLRYPSPRLPSAPCTEATALLPHSSSLSSTNELHTPSILVVPSVKARPPRCIFFIAHQARLLALVHAYLRASPRTRHLPIWRLPALAAHRAAQLVEMINAFPCPLPYASTALLSANSFYSGTTDVVSMPRISAASTLLCLLHARTPDTALAGLRAGPDTCVIILDADWRPGLQDALRAKYAFF